MTNTWLKIRIWMKIIVVFLFALYGIIFLIANSGKTVDVWIWGRYDIGLLPLIFFTFLFGVLTTILVRTTFRTLRQIQELRGRNRSDRLNRDIAQLKAKAERLQTRPEETAQEDLPGEM
jgi:hypothetical protein